MNKVWDFLKVKGFYIALGTGIVAFVALVAIYSYRDKTSINDNDSILDLNQAAVDSKDKGEGNEKTAKLQNDGQNDKQADKQDPELYENDVPGEVQMDEKVTQEEIGEPETLIEDADNFEEEDTKVADKPIVNQETVDVLSNEAHSDNQNQVNPEIKTALSYNGEQVLIWPLVGNIIMPFSMDKTLYFQTLDSYKCNLGMLIAGDEGADVMSVYEGTIKGVSTTKEFGTTVKVELGNGYEVTYGQLMNVQLQQEIILVLVLILVKLLRQVIIIKKKVHICILL